MAAEIAAVRDRVGLAEVNGFNRIELTGRDVHAFLDRMICGRVPMRPGRVGLCYLLNRHGMVKCEATIANLPDGRVWYGSAAASEWHDRDWLLHNIRSDEDVHVRSLTNEWTILVLAGPRARDVLSSVSRADWSREAFPWLSVREAFIGIAPAVVMGVSFSGELAYEIHVPTHQIHAAYQALRAAGSEHGMVLFGARAVEAMRLEKGFLHWKSDLLTEFDPFETGLDRFVNMNKDFLGKNALAKRIVDGSRRKLVTLQVDTDRAPAHGGASVMMDIRVVGTVTSGEWGHRVGKNLAYAFVEPEVFRRGCKTGHRHPRRSGGRLGHSALPLRSGACADEGLKRAGGIDAQDFFGLVHAPGADPRRRHRGGGAGDADGAACTATTRPRESPERRTGWSWNSPAGLA